VTGCEALCELRRRLGYTQQEFAHHASIAIRSLAGWEAGRTPSLAMLFHLVKLARKTRDHDLAKAFYSDAAASIGPKNIKLILEMERRR